MNTQQIEQIVLGIILNDNQKLFKATLISKNDFESEVHQQLFKAICAKVYGNEDANAITLQGVAERAYILELEQQTMGLTSIETYATMLKDLANKRKLKEVLENAQVKLESQESAISILEQINADFSDIQKTSSQYRIRDFNSVVNDILTDSEKVVEYTSTGIEKIDFTMNGGMERGRSYCFAAAPKSGKTMLKGTIANNLRKMGKSFLFVAAEMGEKQITRRILGAELGISVKDIQHMNCDTRDKIMPLVKQSNLMRFVDSPRITLDALRSVVTNAVKNYGIEGFVLDYLQLVTGKPSSDTIAQHQENIAQTIAELCKRENIWALYSCQVNRDNAVRNGDGILMAVDWLYQIERVESANGTDKFWLKHLATRDMPPIDIGSETEPAFVINSTGTQMEVINNGN